MSFNTLPPELHLHILSYLRPFEIERLAQTFNKKLYVLCSPVLPLRLAARRNRQRLYNLFGNNENNTRPKRKAWRISNAAMTEKDYRKYGLEAKYGPFAQTSPPHLDYLDLNGDLSWLGPPDREAGKLLKYYENLSRKDMIDHNHNYPNIAATLERTGIALPSCFRDFICNTQLIYLMQTIYVDVGAWKPNLRRCARYTSKDPAGGYVLPFGFYFATGLIWFLYLDRQGHCVFSSSEDPSDSVDDIVDEDGERDAMWDPGSGLIYEEGLELDRCGLSLMSYEGPNLICADLEELLARLYFEQRLGYVVSRNDEIPPDVEEYIANVYTVRGQGLSDEEAELTSESWGFEDHDA